LARDHKLEKAVMDKSQIESRSQISFYALFSLFQSICLYFDQVSNQTSNPNNSNYGILVQVINWSVNST